jgi:hypothetical protein
MKPNIKMLLLQAEACDLLRDILKSLVESIPNTPKDKVEQLVIDMEFVDITQRRVYGWVDKALAEILGDAPALPSVAFSTRVDYVKANLNQASGE